MWSAFLLAAAQLPAEPSAGGLRASAEGRVSVRIVSGIRINAGAIQPAATPALVETEIRTENGNSAVAKLVEFQ